MNLKRLQALVHLAKYRCFSEVAEIMNMTQSGVSRQIKTLEEESDIQLFERSTSFVKLTPAGHLVFKSAKNLLAEWEQIIQECKEIKDEISGCLKIGVSTIPATSLLPKIIKSMKDKYPRIEFSITTDDSSEILNKLQNQKIDVSIVGSESDDPRLFTNFIADDRLVLIGKQSIPCCTSLSEIRKMAFINRESGSGTRKAIDQALRKSGIEPDVLQCIAECVSKSQPWLSNKALKKLAWIFLINLN
jgi:DNA-binding transcriptional LysR family regulator